MPINFGIAEIQDIKFGNTQISKVFQGNDLVWEKDSIDPVILQPTIESPATDGELDVSPDGPFVSSDFEMASGTDTHTASSWEIMGGLEWTRQPSLEAVGANMNSIAWDGTQFCAVGGKCATSPDGVTWTEQPSFASAVGSASMNSVTWSGTQFCAVGGKCATSPDGVTWTEQPSLASVVDSRDMYEVTWDGSQFCAVGYNGRCATSPDGVTWTLQQSFGPAVYNSNVRSVTWSGTQFCAVGDNGRCATSPDGVTWTKQESLVSAVGATQMKSVVWDGTQYCTVGASAKCATSPDGVAWTLQPSFESTVGGENMYSVTWSGTQFCAVGRYGACATSPDGVTWTNQPSLTPAVGSESMLSVTSNGSQFCAVGYSGTCATEVQSVVASLDRDPTALTSWEPTGLEGNTDYKIRVKYHTATLNSEWSEERSFRTRSLIGEKWTRQPSLESAVGTVDMQSVTWSGTQFCAVGERGKCATSPDGVTWTDQLSLASVVGGKQMNSVVWNGSQFCAVGESGKCATSPDGVTWTAQTGTGSGSLNEVIWDGNRFIIVTPGFEVLTSPDGITWTGGYNNNLAGVIQWQPPLGIAWSGNKYFTYTDGFGNPVGAILASSTDAVTWTELTIGIDMRSVAWDGTQFCVVGNRCITSPDGVTWTLQRSLESAVGSKYMYSVVWDGTQFCAVGEEGKCVTSPDGVTWTLQPSFESAVGISTMNSVTWDGTQLCAVGEDGKCATSPGDVTSPDVPPPVKPTTIEFRKINNFAEVSETFGEPNSLWRLWAHNQNTILTADFSATTNFAMISQDAGETWAPVPNFTTEANKWSSSGRSICYGNGIWINVGDYGRCMTSPNGLDWTKQMGLYDASVSINSTNHFNKVIHNGTYFLAVGRNMVARSTDGITWEARKLPLSSSVPGHNQDSTTFYDVVWDGQKFVATGSGVDSQAQARKAIAFYSTDGLTWTESDLHTVYSGTQTECRSISWNGSVFVILGKTNTLAKSTDGITWSATGFGPGQFEPEQSFSLFTKMANNNNYFIAPEGYALFRISQTADDPWYDANNDTPFTNWSTPYYNGSEFMIFARGINYEAELYISTNSADVDTF